MIAVCRAASSECTRAKTDRSKNPKMCYWERGLPNAPERGNGWHLTGGWARIYSIQLNLRAAPSDLCHEPTAMPMQTTSDGVLIGGIANGDWLAMQALFARHHVQVYRPPRRPVSINLAPRIAEFFANRSPHTLAWSGIAAALVMLLQAGLLTGIMLKEKSPGGYETASAPTRVASEGAYVLIRFQPQADAADITQFLETNKLSIADGPSAGGLYRVRVAAGKLAKADLARIVRTLQDNRVVGFIAMTE